MPVSGHEETGVKSIAGQFNDFIAGVPIKKRRFPIIRPSSPLSEEPSSLPEDTELLRKEYSSTSQGSTLSNASIAGAPIKKRRFPLIQASSSPSEEPCSLPEENEAVRKEHSSTSLGSTLSTSSSGLSDTNRNPISEERKASADVHAPEANNVQSNPNYIRPKLEEPSLAIATQSCTLDVMDSKEKVVLKEVYDEKLGSQISKGKSDLLLAGKEGLALNLGGCSSKQNVEVKCKQENLVAPESTDLSLGLKKPSFPTLVRQDIDESRQEKDKAETVSLKLSLSKEEGSSTSLIGGDKSNSDRTHVQSIRANWDLNTTMDAWEESASNAASGRTSSDGLKNTGSAIGEKQFMCSTGMATTDVDTERQTYLECKNRAVTVPSTLCFQQYRGKDKHNLCITSSSLQKFSEESCRLSAKLNSGSAVPIPKVATSCGDTSIPSFRVVKTEPVDENLKQDLKEASPCQMGSLDSVTIKREVVERSSPEAFKSNSSNLKSDDLKFVKSEPAHDVNQARPNTAEDKSDQLGSESQQGSVNCSSPLALPMTLATKAISASTACPLEKPICSTEITTSANATNHLENSVCIEGPNVDGKECHGACSSTDQVSLETVATADVEKCAESSSNVPVLNDSERTEGENVKDPDGCRVKLMNELPPDPRVSGEACVSDDEMITLSADMMEDYGSDYDSDDNHALTVAMDTEQYGEDDYEDGEVREPLEHSTAEETILEVKEVEHAGCSSYESKLTESGAALSGDCALTSSHVEEIDNQTALLKTVTCNEVKMGKDGVDAEINEESDKVADINVCVRETVNAEKQTVGSDVKKAVRPLQGKSTDLLERKNAPQGLEKELSSDQVTNGCQGVDVAECADEVVKKTDMVRKTDSDLPKKEASSNTDDVAKDINNGGNQGRIINLSRAAGTSFPSKTRSLTGRSLPSRAGRDILSDGLDGDKLHRGRDEYYIDGPRRFSTERHQELSPRNSRLHFGRGRGRITNRLETHGDWESDREYSGEFYNGPSYFRGPRHKYASNIADADMEYNNIAPDGSFVGTGRLGRKVFTDEGPLCRHIPSRRRSPGGREVPTGRSIQMGNRIPRDMSPTRCIGGSNGSEMVGMRHNEKFMRGFPEDALDPPMFTRPQQFEGLDGRFTRGNRSFSSIQRRNIPRIRSKSPIRSRSRSPGPWSSPRRRSPRRRSPDGFGGHPEVTHRRSPLYRPDRPVFPGERIVRRNGSPSYMSRPSNDIRDIDSGRDHGHPRSVISRSPGRMLLRNRRFNVVDPRDRSDNDEYFGGPMPSGRMLDLSGEGNGDQRRRFGERRGPVRTFRPHYNNGAVGENFHLNSGDGPRHYRFCTDDDSDFHERGNLREREFDRRIKNSRPTNGPPRRTRNIDDQEANYRHGGGQVWSDDSFDDISRIKRKRF